MHWLSPSPGTMFVAANIAEPVRLSDSATVPAAQLLPGFSVVSLNAAEDTCSTIPDTSAVPATAPAMRILFISPLPLSFPSRRATPAAGPASGVGAGRLEASRRVVGEIPRSG